MFIMDFNTHELAWAAGFFDGEGYTHATAQKRNLGPRQVYSSLRLSVSQVSPIALERFRTAVNELGSIKGPYKNKNPNSQPFYVYVATSFEEVQAIVCMLWPWLGPLKRQQAKDALHGWLSRPRLKPGRKMGTPLRPDMNKRWAAA